MSFDSNRTVENMKQVDHKHYAFQSAAIREIDYSVLVKRFENMARWYAYFLKDHLPVDKDVPILDMPCGHGNFLWFLNRAGYKNAIGVDLDPGRVDIAQDMGLPAQQADAFDYLSSASNLAVIASLDFIEHIDKQRVPNLLALFYRALRPGGALMLRTPITDSLLGTHDLYNDYTHKWDGNSGLLCGLLRQEGFSSVTFKDERPVLYKLVNYIRFGVFHIAKTFTNLWLVSLGFSPRTVWSTSGWYIARKP